MGILKRWSRFEEEKLEDILDVYGVYELGNRLRNVIYIGQGKLQSRLWDHFESDDPCISKAYWFRYDTTGSKLRAEQRERALMDEYWDEYGRYPECNKRYG